MLFGCLLFVVVVDVVVVILFSAMLLNDIVEYSTAI